MELDNFISKKEEYYSIKEIYLKMKKLLEQLGKYESIERVLAALMKEYRKKQYKEFKWSIGMDWKKEFCGNSYTYLPPLQGLIDHPYSIKRPGEKKIVVSEPYSVSLNNLKALIAFCEETGYGCIIDGRAIHYPGRTVRILLAKMEVK
jgi:hypothetical protein